MTSDFYAHPPAHAGQEVVRVAGPDLDRSLAFYEPVLASIGIDKVLERPPGDLSEMYGFGTGRPFFWLIADGRVSSNMYLAFTAETRETTQP